MNRQSRILAVAGLLALLPATVLAGERWPPVGDTTLEQARGGFETPAGLQLSLGIERLVSINDTVVSKTSFMIADVTRLSVDEANQARSALTAMNVLQNGAGNVFSPGPLGQAMAGTVIQNTLNDQLLQTQTIIHTSVNSLELLKIANFQDTLQHALGNVAAPR